MIKPFIPEYVKNIIEQENIPYEIVKSKVRHGSSLEKSHALDWDLERVISTLYFDNVYTRIGIITPASTKLDIKHILKTNLDITSNQAKKYTMNKILPYGMMRGTCSPFVKELDEVYMFISMPISNPELIVDVSLGGLTEDSCQTSIQLKHKDLERIISNYSNYSSYNR